MKKFLALYMAPTASLDEMMANSTPEDQKKGMEEWMQWMQSHEADIVDHGAPAGKNKRVMGSDVQDVRNEVCGYTIVQAESHEKAAEMFANMPHMGIKGGYVEVVELMDMPGM